jgi:hypothetical protein
MSASNKTLKQVSHDFMKRLQAMEEPCLTKEGIVEAYDREIRPDLFSRCEQLVDTSAKQNLRSITAIDSALFDSYLNKLRASTWKAQDEEIRRFIGIESLELTLLRSEPNIDQFFKKVYLNSETLNRVLNLLKMADFYAGVRPDKTKQNLNISSIIWEPNTPLSYKSESYTCKFLKTCLRLVASYAKESFTGKDTVQLFSKISLMLLLRSNPVLGLMMPVGSVLTSSIAIPAITKVLSISGVFTKAENGLTKHQLMAFIQTHSNSLDHMQKRAEILLENINKAFDTWLMNEDEDEELILRECLRIEIENFEAANLVLPFGDEYIMQDLEDGWTKIDLKPK